MWIATGCYQPTVPTGAPCSDGEPCPSNQACIAGACRTGTVPGDGDLPDLPDQPDGVPGLDASPIVDGPPATGWSTPVRLATLSIAGSEDYGPSITADGSRMFFNSNRPGSTGFAIWTAIRTGSTWSAPVRIATLDSAVDDYDPEVSATGSELYYTSDAAPYGLWRSTPAGIGWDAGTSVTSLVQRVGLTLADGDLRMLVMAQGLIFEMTRPSTASTAWTVVRNHAQLANLEFPGMSWDALEVFAMRDGKLYRATRASTSVEFGAPSLVDIPNTSGLYVTDPELTQDGKTLYLSIANGGDNDLYVTTRP